MLALGGSGLGLLDRGEAAGVAISDDYTMSFCAATKYVGTAVGSSGYSFLFRATDGCFSLLFVCWPRHQTLTRMRLCCGCTLTLLTIGIDSSSSSFRSSSSSYSWPSPSAGSGPSSRHDICTRAQTATMVYVFVRGPQDFFNL